MADEFYGYEGYDDPEDRYLANIPDYATTAGSTAYDNDYTPTGATTADGVPVGMNPKGSWPGKKYGALKRVLQVGTMGMYPLDDRLASSVNARTLKSQAAFAEGQRQEAAMRQAQIKEMTDSLVAVGMDPAEAIKTSHSVWASQYTAGVAANKAAEASSNVSRETSMGRMPFARASGSSGQQGIDQANRAKLAQDTNVETQANTERELGVPEQTANVADREGNLTLGEIQRQKLETQGQAPLDVFRRANQQAELDGAAQKLRTLNAVGRQTMPQQISTGVSTAEALQDRAAAEAGYMQDNAPDFVKARMEKEAGVQLPYGGEFYTVGGQKIAGPERVQRPTGAPGYKIVKTYDAAGNEVMSEKIPTLPYGAPGTNGVPTTAQPAGTFNRMTAPEVAPGLVPFKIPKSRVDQIRNPQ